MTTIYLCQVQEIDSTYQNVLHFNSRSQQLAFFNSRVVKVVNGHNLKPDDMRSEITLNSGYNQQLNACDYLFFEGKNGVTYFYFIDNLEFVTEQTCKAYVTLDVWSTHHLNLTVHKSFVEQMHVPRWKSSGVPMEGEIYDEGFPQYQAQLKEMRRVVEVDGVYIYASTMPLGIGIVSGTGGGESQSYDMVDGDGNGWSYPTTGTITATYPDYSDGTFHGGVDFANTLNTPIKAIANGTVVAKNSSTTGYGNHLVVEHMGQNGVAYQVWYAHLNEFADNTHVGNNVDQGEVIGLMGSSGNSTGCHLHLEIRKPPYNSGSYNVINSNPLYSVGDTIHPNIKLRVGDVIG